MNICFKVLSFVRLLILGAVALGCGGRSWAGEITLEDNSMKVSFDSDSGALTQIVDKFTHWTIERRPQLGASFRLYAPLPNRRYNPVFGKDQHVANIRTLSNNEIEMQWTNLLSQNGGHLPITLTADVTLTNDVLIFAATLENHSPLTIETIEYPDFGDLNPPSRDSTLAAYTTKNGQLDADELYPHFCNEKGYWGVTYPTKMLQPQGRSFCLIESADQGLYVGTEHRPDYRVQYIFEQHPGLISGTTSLVPPGDEISGWPVHLDFRVCHFVFLPPHSNKALEPIVLYCYRGHWMQKMVSSK